MSNDVPVAAMYLMIGLGVANAFDRMELMPRNVLVNLLDYVFTVIAWPYVVAYNTILYLGTRIRK